MLQVINCFTQVWFFYSLAMDPPKPFTSCIMREVTVNFKDSIANS